MSQELLKAIKAVAEKGIGSRGYDTKHNALCIIREITVSGDVEPAKRNPASPNRANIRDT